MSTFTKILIPFCFDLIGLCQILSGIVLLKSVISIRNFFKARNDLEYIDIATLVRHAVCFGSYLLFCSLYYLTYTYYILDGSHFSFVVFTWSTNLYLVGNFVSEALLCQIYWSLATKVDPA